MTPADELRAAAAKLRERAKAATAGEWTVVRDDVGGGKFCTGVWAQMGLVGGQYVTEEMHSREADAAWIALMGPDKAESLAAWLDEDAREIETVQDVVDINPNWPALVFARAVLGEKP